MGRVGARRGGGGGGELSCYWVVKRTKSKTTVRQREVTCVVSSSPTSTT